jgi:CubicO group peptidase (beta-lactamase class C family)
MKTLICFVAAVFLVAPLAVAEPGELAVAEPRSVGIDEKPLSELAAAISRSEFPKTNAVLVVRGGKLAYEAYFGSGGPDVLNDTRSAMKSITSLAVGTAIADGAISSAKERAFDFLGELRPFENDTREKRAITIEDLLTMSSALDCNDDDDNSPGNEDKMHSQQNWTRWAVDLPTMQGYQRDANGLGPWRYCTAGSVLLGQIVQRAARMPVDKYIEQRLLLPLGIHRWEWPYSPSGEAMTGGGLRLRARDAAKVAWMLVDHGKWNGKQVVPQSWIDDALTERRAAYPGLGYGYLFWRHTYTTPCGQATGWYMAGNGGNAVLAFKELNAAVVIARANYNTRGMHQQTEAMLVKYILPSMLCRATG